MQGYFCGYFCGTAVKMENDPHCGSAFLDPEKTNDSGNDQLITKDIMISILCRQVAMHQHATNKTEHNNASKEYCII